MLNLSRVSMTSRVLLLCGVVLTFGLFWLGHSIAPQLKIMGMTDYLRAYKWQGGLVIFSFTFAFPVALQCIVLAGLFTKVANYRHVIWSTLIFAAGSILVVLWPFIVGSAHSRWYFGIGGGLLLVLIFAVGWLWAQQRQQHDKAYRLVLDLRGAGYFFFALATWNTCGILGMPGYALYPARSMSVHAYPFIIGQSKVVMLYLILGWVFILLSHLRIRALRGTPR